MASLLESLQKLPQQRTVLCFPSGAMQGKDIVHRATHLRNSPFADLRGKRVALIYASIESYLECLIALDGWVSDLILLDDLVDSKLLLLFEDRAQVEYRITASDQGPRVVSCNRAIDDVVRLSVTSWIIPTSGTTGTPKLITHTFESLTRSVKAPSKRSADFRWGLLYDPTRFAGLQVILQSILGGSALILPHDWRDLVAAIQILKKHQCNALSATPSLWRKLAISGWLKQFNFKLITLGGEAPDQKILDLLKQTYPDAVLRHIYASTEAGVGFSVADGKIGFPATYLKNPPKGIELQVRDDGMLMFKVTKIQQSTISKNDSFMNESGWIESGDLVQDNGERYEFLGRLNGAINVGGQKVHPTQIEGIIAGVPGVAAIRAYGEPSSILGNLVAVDIEAERDVDHSELLKSVKDACQAGLNRFQRPTTVTIVDQIKLTSTGKIKR